MLDLICYCTQCHKECLPNIIDEGYGQTEAWGHKTIHHDYIAISDCCDAPMVNAFDESITPTMAKIFNDKINKELILSFYHD